MPESYLPILIALGVGGGLAVIIMALSQIIGPRKKTDPVKLVPYECGLDQLGNPRSRIHVKFYLVAILFIIFDIDGLSIIPWAMVVRELGWFGIIEIGIFVLFMLFALVYAWRKGAFKWE